MTVTATAIKPECGIELTGLRGHDFADPASAEQCAELLDGHGVVVYREAHVDNDDLVTFSAALGEIQMGGMGRLESHPEIDAVTLDPAKSSLADYRKGTFYWHIDGTNQGVPQKATLLTARQVSDEGGDTEFANTYAAYAALDEGEKAALVGVQVMHTFAATQRLVHPDASERDRRMWDKVPSCAHPLVWTRRNGRKSMLIGMTADYVVGWPQDQSRALLDRLLEWSTQPRFVVRHHWQVGDLVAWDNTGMLHRAIPYEPTSPRLMYRTTLLGEEAVA
jgi:alpha-ketoglutarate-dependent taurine dioxygenase